MPEEEAAGRKGWGRRLLPVLTVLFVLLVLALVVRQARLVNWAAVVGALRETRARDLAAALGLSAISFLVYSCYDLVGRASTGHRLPARQVMNVAFISYAFNLNFGSLIGGVAFRFRLYSRHGLAKGVIAHVLALSLVTNWLGYLLLAGGVFALRLVDLPERWFVGTATLQALGIGLLCVVAAYLAACASGRWQWVRVRTLVIPVPSLKMALVQLALSMTNWLLMGGVAWFLMAGTLPYPAVFSVLLVGAIAGVITHVPANLGVLETVFVTLLASRAPEERLLAAVLAYRACYYLVPLAVAAASYLATEARMRPSRISSTTGG